MADTDVIDRIASPARGETPRTLERRIVDLYQKGFPLEPRPYAAIAKLLGSTEEEVIAALGRLKENGVLSRIGAVVRPNTAGASTLAALAVPEGRLEKVAEIVNLYPEVNHNYEREHRFNLWFVVTAPDRRRIDQVLREINAWTGLEVLDLPLEEAFHIDLGFPVQWD